MSLRVDTHIGGSFCVVWKNREHYLDARRYYGDCDFTAIELVDSGQVYYRENVPNRRAPERIIKLMRERLA